LAAVDRARTPLKLFLDVAKSLRVLYGDRLMSQDDQNTMIRLLADLVAFWQTMEPTKKGKAK